MMYDRNFVLTFVDWLNTRSWEHDYREQRTHRIGELLRIFETEHNFKDKSQELYNFIQGVTKGTVHQHSPHTQDILKYLKSFNK